MGMVSMYSSLGTALPTINDSGRLDDCGARIASSSYVVLLCARIGTCSYDWFGNALPSSTCSGRERATCGFGTGGSGRRLKLVSRRSCNQMRAARFRECNTQTGSE